MSFWTGSRVTSVAVASFLFGCHTTYNLMEDPRFAIQSLRFLNPKSAPIRAEMPLLANNLRNGFVRESENPEKWTVFTIGWGSSTNSYRKREPVVEKIEKREVKEEKSVSEATPVVEKVVMMDVGTEIVEQLEVVQPAETTDHHNATNEENLIKKITQGKPKKVSQTN